ncbi:XkdQ/YqbQ family protein [Priestia megaterium]|uniref:XkdQ/YqbQ family protein n=1 Tax=Priestia megaterium TaxID=1404 RepID=UPI003D0138F4
MTLDVKILNRQGTGGEWDVSEIVEGLSWKTSRIGKAGSVSFKLVKGSPFESSNFTYNNGDIVRVRVDKTNVFHGYIFSIDEGRDEAVTITAYDQIRYLMNVDTYVFKGVTVTEILQRIAKDFGLKLGTVADTGYKIPTMSEDSQKLLDIVTKGITLTFSNTGRDYCLYDDFGALCLRGINDVDLDLFIGDGSLMYDYEIKRSIDSDTYNRIKLFKDNKDTGNRELYIAQDSANIKKWGLLQLYQGVDEDMNKAQINALLSKLATLKNRETKSLKVNALGDIRVRAGMRVRIVISEYGVDQALLVDECSHDFDGAAHTMSLDLRVV